MIGSRVLLVLLALAPVARAEKKPDAIRLLALGDSFTIGTGSGAERSFPERMAARWRAVGRTVVVRNLAVNGYTTDALIDEELPAARGFAPTLVTLAIGANDLVRGSPPDRYRAQVRRILRALLDDGVAASKIVALPQPDWSGTPVGARFGEPAAIAARLREFNRILREEATAVGARYLDIFPLMERQAAARMVAGDGLHPSAQAYDEWAGELVRQLAP